MFKNGHGLRQIYPWWKYFKRPLPDIKEMDELKIRTQSFKAIFSGGRMTNSSRYKTTLKGQNLVFVSHDFNQVNSFELTEGRYFTDLESAAGRSVCIIGYDIAVNLFPFQTLLVKM